MHALVCAATRAEHDAIADGLRAAGQAGAKGIALLVTGVGAARARDALAARLGAKAPRPSLVVSAGFAGAATAGLAPGDWVTAARLFACEEKGRAALPLGGVAVREVFVAALRVARCDVLSVPELAVDAASVIGESGDDGGGDAVEARPLVVDMESAALANVAAARGICFAVLRMISDAPDAKLPGFLAPFTNALASTSTRERLTHAARGARGALADPRGVLRLVRDGARWTRQLADGWTHAAPHVAAAAAEATPRE